MSDDITHVIILLEKYLLKRASILYDINERNKKMVIKNKELIREIDLRRAILIDLEQVLQNIRRELLT